MKKDDQLTTFYELFSQSFSDIESSNPFPEAFYQALLSGKNTIYQKDISETKKFDETWIKTVESYFPSIDKITRNPKTGLYYEEEIIPIEKVKKINSASIRHLASHSHLIKEVQSDGFVIPKKLLTSTPDIEYATYENRFIMTLIKRLSLFVKRRYRIIRENVESYQRKHMNFNSNFKLDKTEVSLDIDLVLKDELDNTKINEYNYSLLGRVEHLNKLINSMMAGQFMELLKKAKEVHSPIMKTNIILKNVDFQNAYLLWIFIERYNNLEYDTLIKEKNLTIDDNYLKDIYKLALSTFSTVAVNQKARKKTYDEILERRYFKKGTEQILFHIADIAKAPDPIPVEDTLMNEYFLNETKRVFNQMLERNISENEEGFQVSLRKAIRDTLDITNNLYSSFFEFNNGDEDIFQLLVTEINLDKDLQDATKKVKIARIIREVKEADYKKAIKLEENLNKDIANVNRQLIKDAKKNATDKRKKAELAYKLKYQSALDFEKEKKSNEYRAYIEAANQSLKEIKENVNIQIKDDNKNYRQYEKEELQKAEQLAKEYYDRELKKLKERIALNKTREKEKLQSKIKEARQQEKNLIKMKKDRDADLEAKQKKIFEDARKKLQIESKKLEKKGAKNK